MTRAVGWYLPGPDGLRPASEVGALLERLDEPFAVVSGAEALGLGGLGLGVGGVAQLVGAAPRGGLPLVAWVHALTPDLLGEPSFRDTYGVRIAYATGAMANGIASVELVSAIARGGGIGFFGAAGLSTERIAEAVGRLSRELGALPWGVNLIHSPAEPWQEQQTVDLLLQRSVRAVEVSAYLGLTPMVVQLRASGLTTAPDGRVVPRTRLLAKVSRPEVAEKFLRPPPQELLRALVQRGKLTEQEAKLASALPMADDLTAEADSGGHTDNRPLLVLLPLLQSLRDRVCAEQRYATPVRVGAAGGMGSPAAVAAAFAMGAAYVVTGTVNQACVEAGTSPLVKQMLASAGMADVDMAPASDMFEAGVELQVLKRGTLFPMRAAQLYELYRQYPSLEALPGPVRDKLETKTLQARLDDIWGECTAFFQERDPAQLERASRDPKHKMALVFRWYLGKSSRWAIAGEDSRRTDVQVWCGPAIGAFNDWSQGTFLQQPAQRRVVAVAANLMTGAATLLRARSLRDQGVEVRTDPYGFRPRPLAGAPGARTQDEGEGLDVRP
jgi:trans-AT polyketide synthase/acyltransferase/oxidoreductase domain-containing protein